MEFLQAVWEYLIEPYSDVATHFIILEMIAVVFGISSVYFAQKANIWVYPMGIISTLIYIYITFVVGYIGDFTINIYYTIMSVYGWWVWSRARDGKTLPIQRAQKKDWSITVAITLFTGALVTTIYLYFDMLVTWQNYLDIFTTMIAYSSMYLMARKKLENWIGWIIVDVVSVPLYLTKGLGFTALQFFVFLILAIQGYIIWKRAVEKQKTEAPL
ncbi:MAG: nicotinamide riboside transporter PnuC [Weeksellaceae bacterium]|nr:nicotinamide riboside transporter PnuC [Weeksellaceae bacterium]